MPELQLSVQPSDASPIAGHGSFSMKIRSALSILALILLMPIAVGSATETINMDVVANVDRFGDGSMKITFHLSAMQWAIWKQQYGDHLISLISNRRTLRS